MPPAAAWMVLKIFILNKVNQTEKDKYHMISLTCGVQKKVTNELIYKTNIDSQSQKANLWPLQEGKWWGGIDLEFRNNRHTLLYKKRITSKDLLHTTGSYIEYLVITYNGKESEKITYIGKEYKYIHIFYITASLCSILETNTPLQINIFGVFLLLFFFCLLAFSRAASHGIWMFPGQGSNQSCSHPPTPEPQQREI